MRISRENFRNSIRKQQINQVLREKRKQLISCKTDNTLDKIQDCIMRGDVDAASQMLTYDLICSLVE